MTTWVFNEPWPNGGGPYLVDYDGRPLMIYDFLKQALAPVSLSLRSESSVFDPAVGIEAQLWLVSDAPAPATELRWSWLLRDLEGGVIANGEGSASIQPLEALQLALIKTGPLEAPAERMVLVELQLTDSGGALLSERVHLFGSSASSAPFAGLPPGQVSTDHALSPAVLEAEVSSRESDGATENLQLTLTNTGPMTALFCEPHPLLSYRTDIDIDNNHLSIPPGGTRAITIAAPHADSELTLSQTGWRISCWNAEDVLIAPSDEVHFSLGRRDAMTRELQGYTDPSSVRSQLDLTIEGRRPDPSTLPYLMTGDRIVRFMFDIAERWDQPSRLRLHTADQDNRAAVQLMVIVNGQSFQGTLKPGLGIQIEDPAHLAFPQTAEFHLPAGSLHQGRNSLEVQISNDAWFTWDAIDLTAAG